MKRIAFGAKRPSTAKAGSIDDWVLDRETSEREPTKRFTIDVPVSLHKRVKIQCAQQNLVMADVMRELLERRFPASGGPRPLPTGSMASMPEGASGSEPREEEGVTP